MAVVLAILAVVTTAYVGFWISNYRGRYPTMGPAGKLGATRDGGAPTSRGVGRAP